MPKTKPRFSYDITYQNKEGLVRQINVYSENEDDAEIFFMRRLGYKLGFKFLSIKRSTWK